MKVKIKRIDKTLPIPQYKTSGAAGFDLYSRETVTILPQQVALIPLNVVLDIPADTWVLLAPRSSTHKLGITAANGIGIGDGDYCGEKDEYHFAALNFTNQKVSIPRGTRVAQAVLVHYRQVSFEEVEQTQKEDRGGFGSTGTT